MSRRNLIEQKLSEIDGARFQKLCDAILFAEGYKHICSWGSASGSDKTKTGTPDSYVQLANGNFVFIEYTTQNKSVYKKFLEDIDKCFDYGKTGVPLRRIEKIILCYNSKLSVEESKKLSDYCSEKGGSLEHYNMDTLTSLLLLKFPYVAKEQLGISVDSGQILPVEQFIRQKRQFSTSLDNTFLFREAELQQVANDLEGMNVVVLSGKPGVGKTKLALEAMERFKEAHSGYELFCIDNKGVSLYEDLQLHFSGVTHGVVLVDDANRISQLRYLFDLLFEEKKVIKLILTVRDYALEEVRRHLSQYRPNIYSIRQIKPFEKKQLEEIIQSSTIIKNFEFLERICDIAEGNPRLALMAAHVAVEAGSLASLGDVYEIYERFFEKVTTKLEEFNNKSINKTLAILSFFRTIDRHAERSKRIYNSFFISEDEFWGNLEILHGLEFVDLYENDVCRISDQILATFFFYRVVIKEGGVPFRTFLKNFFLMLPHHMREALYGVINTFDYSLIKSQIQYDLDEFLNNPHLTEDERLLFMETFWIVRQTETLLYIHEKIEALPHGEQPEDYELGETNEQADPYFNILTNFIYSSFEEFQMSMEIMFIYLEKQPRLARQFLQYIKNHVSYSRTSYRLDYIYQIKFFEMLFEKVNENPLLKQIIVEVILDFLKVGQEEHASKGKNVTFYRFFLVRNDGLHKLRDMLWTFLFKHYNVEQVLPILNDYVLAMRRKECKEILECDIPFIAIFINDRCSPSVYEHCVFVQSLASLVESCSIQNEQIAELGKSFTNEIYEISKLLYIDPWNKRELRQNQGISYEDIEKIRVERICNHFKHYRKQDYLTFVEHMKIILSAAGARKYDYQSAMGIVFHQMLKKDLDLFIEVFQCMGKELQFEYSGSITQALDMYPECHDKIYQVICKGTDSHSMELLVHFFLALPDAAVDQNYLSCLLYLVAKWPSGSYFNFYVLDKFIKIDPKVYVRVLRVMVENWDRNKYNFHQLFSPYASHYEKLAMFFQEEDMCWLERAYLLQQEFGNEYDDGGEIIKLMVERNPVFLVQYFEQLCVRKSYLSRYDDERDYSKLWSINSIENIMTSTMDYLLTNQKTHNASYIATFLMNFQGNECARERILTFIKSYIIGHAQDIQKMKLIFVPLTRLYGTELQACLQLFLAHNNKLGDFQELRLGWQDFTVKFGPSLTAIFEQEKQFWESLLPLMSSIRLLKHKVYIQQRVASYQEQIKQELRCEFLEEK